jgi:hypothetical protein
VEKEKRIKIGEMKKKEWRRRGGERAKWRVRENEDERRGEKDKRNNKRDVFCPFRR